jgi:DNA-directed RNA polymerase subunit RPC12/RpoP
MAWWHACSHCGDLDHECYEVKCARCGKDGWSNEFYIEEGDEWECPPCWKICEDAERIARRDS